MPEQQRQPSTSQIEIPWPLKIVLREECEHVDPHLKALLIAGRMKGYLTFDDVINQLGAAFSETIDTVFAQLADYQVEVTDHSAPETRKMCPGCGNSHRLNRFYYLKYSYAELWANCCKWCADRASRRKKWLTRKYGICDFMYLDLLAAQFGLCAICGKRSTKTLHVDHCHQSEKVRALLCGHCNKGIGLFADDPARLRAAADYVEKHKGR